MQLLFRGQLDFLGHSSLPELIIFHYFLIFFLILMHFLPINSSDLRKNSQQYMVFFLYEDAQLGSHSRLWWGCISNSVFGFGSLTAKKTLWCWRLSREGNRTGEVLPRRGKFSSSGWSSFFGRLEVLGCAWVVIMKCFVERRLLLLAGCSGFQQEFNSVTGVIN